MLKISVLVLATLIGISMAQRRPPPPEEKVKKFLLLVLKPLERIASILPRII